MSPSTRSTAATVTWGALGALIPVLIAAAVLVWQGGALAEQIPTTVSAVADHEVRIRGLEDDRAGIAELKTDVGWIRREMESERGD
jgi:HAMP domain-containing protein